MNNKVRASSIYEKMGKYCHKDLSREAANINSRPSSESVTVMATTFFVQRFVAQPGRHNARNCTKKSTFYRPKSTASQSAKENLSWPEYLTIRGQKHRWETVSSFHHATSRFLSKKGV